MIAGFAHKDGMRTGSTSANTVRFVIGSLDIGGTEMHLARLLPLLSDSFEPVVITLTHKGKLADNLQSAGIRVLQPPAWVRRLQRIPVLKRIIGPPLTVIYLMIVFIRTPARLTCFYLPASYILGMAAAILTGNPRGTVMFRRSLNDYQRKRPLARYIEVQLHQLVRMAVGNSREVVRQLIEDEYLPAGNTALIYNGLDSSRYISGENRATNRSKLGIAEDVTVLTIVANLIPYKGHLDLIDALAMIKERVTHPWLLLCVGGGIEQRPDLVARVHERNLDGQVRWLGQVDDVAEILSMSDIGLLVSHQEGFSNSVLEGMAAGLPMIVTDVGGNPEAVIHQECGLVVPTARPLELAEAILTLINDREIAKRYGAAARQRVQKIYSMDSCVQQYKRLFERLLAE